MPEPTLVIFHQTTWSNRLFTGFAATRPAFFSASVLAVFVGLGLSWHLAKTIHMGFALATVVAVMGFHAGANVLNDYYDVRNDNANSGRIYPFSGGSRFIQNRVLSAAATFRLGVGLLAGGVVVGLILVWLTGPTLLWIGLAGGLLAVFYSAPPCLACRGLGDVTIALAFGVLPVTGTVWLQLGEIPVSAVWLGTIVGIFTAAILWVNSIPDIAADRNAGKWTLPACLGPRNAPYGLALLFFVGFALIAFAPVSGAMRWSLLGIITAIPAVMRTFRGELSGAIPLVLLTHAGVCGGLLVGGWR